MASDLSSVQYVQDQICGAGEVEFKKMFGEYAIYCDKKVVGLVCNHQFFVKPTASGRDLLEDAVEAAPYEGAKPHFLIGDILEDSYSASHLVKLAAAELSRPKLKRAKT